MNDVRRQSIQALWEAITAIPGLVERADISKKELFERDPCACGADGDDYWYLISVDASGAYSLSYTTRGNEQLEFQTNHSRSLAVYLAYVMIGRLNYPDLGHSPYVEAPFMFELEERHELDEYENERLVVRWHLGQGYWAEVPARTSLVYGLEWAWMFTRSDNTIGYSVADRDSHRRPGTSSGKRYPLPSGDLQNLTLASWNSWRSAVDN